MGSKTVARRTVRDAGAPVVPGTVEPVSDPEEGRRVAAEIGYPVMLKASAGGGGKGMRLVHAPEELASALGRAGSEAAAAFGTRRSTSRRPSSSRGISRFNSSPTSRELVVSRRTRVLDAAPAPEGRGGVPRTVQRRGPATPDGRGGRDDREGGELRGRRNDRVPRRRRSEFLFPRDEHAPAGRASRHGARDRARLVHAQIRIAAGEPLSVHPGRCRLRGSRYRSAGLCRGSRVRVLTVARPNRPVARTCRTRRRVDSGVYEGWEVAIHYDPMLAKLAVWAETREKPLPGCAAPLPNTPLVESRRRCRSFARSARTRSTLRATSTRNTSIDGSWNGRRQGSARSRARSSCSTSRLLPRRSTPQSCAAAGGCDRWRAEQLEAGRSVLARCAGRQDEKSWNSKHSEAIRRRRSKSRSREACFAFRGRPSDRR